MPRFRSRARLAVQPLEGRDVPNGTIAASLSPTGVLTLTGDDNDNDVRLTESGGNLTLSSASGTQFSGQTLFPLTSVKLIKANLLGGADTVSIDPAADFVVPGSVSLNLGDGNNTLNLTTTGKITLAGLTVTGGDGLDTINVSGGAGSTIGGTAKFTLGNGGTVTNLTGVGFTAVNFAAGEAAGDGVSEPTNSVVGTNLSVTKTFMANMGNGNPSVLDFTGGAPGSTTLGGLKVSGTSVVSSLTNTTVNGSVTYKATFGAAVLGNGLSVTGNVSVTAANASFSAIDTGAVTITGNLSVTGSFLTTADFDSGALSEVKGNLSVKGGVGNDEFFASSAFKVDKNLTLNLGGGNNTVQIGDTSAALTVGGTASITTGDGIDSVSFSDVSWTGPVTLSLKGGGDLLSIDDGTTFHSTFTADTGAGDDIISIAQDTGSSAPVTFTGKAKITAGAGNDSLFLGLAQGVFGGDNNSKAVFNTTTSVVDGGLGLDFFDATSGQFTGVTPVNWQ